MELKSGYRRANTYPANKRGTLRWMWKSNLPTGQFPVPATPHVCASKIQFWPAISVHTVSAQHCSPGGHAPTPPTVHPSAMNRNIYRILISTNKKHSENADTPTSATFDLVVWPWPFVKVKKADVAYCIYLGTRYDVYGFNTVTLTFDSRSSNSIGTEPVKKAISI